MALTAQVKIRLLDETINVDSTKCAEETLFDLAKVWPGFNIKPITVLLFGIRTRKKVWLAPNQVLKDFDKDQLPLEVRLRFKVPTPIKLKDLDKSTFIYYFRQLRNDFCSGEVAKVVNAYQFESSSKKNRWYLPIIWSDSNEDSEKKKVKFHSVVAHLAGMLMTIDVLDHNLSVKEVIKNSQDYIPTAIFTTEIDKFVGSSKIKPIVENIINNFLEENVQSHVLQTQFLNEMEENFPIYFEESFQADLNVPEPRSSSKRTCPVKLVVKPPFRSTLEPFHEKEPELVMYQEFEGKKCGEETCLCLVEDLCNISVDESLTSLKLARKNGIPLEFTIKSRQDSMAFLSLLSGYYRLCEKWTFPLCSAISYPSLQFNLANNLHGPVSSEFIEEKFQMKAKGKVGTFLLSQSCQTFNTFHLHYLEENSDKPKILNIIKVGNRYKFVDTWMEEKGFDSLIQLMKFLRDPVRKSYPPTILKYCLHPSEFDKSPTLLICRAMTKVQADVIGGEIGGALTELKVVIPFKQLSRFEKEVKTGNFTKVWKGIWHKSKTERQEVAIKQLKFDKALSKMTEFSHMCYDILNWNDSTLVKAYGVCLHTKANPMAVVMEYYPMGTLNNYLEKFSVEDVDLMEACASLAHALWFLEENDIQPHGNIRCNNIFVAEHTSNTFKVKLGDTGLSDVYSWDHVHWLPLEDLVKEIPRRDQCTIKSDVWALATTFWQIFSHGTIPLQHLDHYKARILYFNGFRLEMPARLKESSVIGLYNVMQECWDPEPDLRKEPQSIMRDTNQLLYQAFNSRHNHSYTTVDDDDAKSVSSSGTLVTSRFSSGSLSSISTVFTRLESHGDSLSTIPTDLNGMDCSSLNTRNLVPTFTDLMNKFMKQGRANTFDDLPRRLDSPSDSSQNGKFSSRFTSQTSLASFSTIYSMSSIYKLSRESQLELNKDIPLGEGHFGVVYKGIMTRSDGDWDQVAVKMIKDPNSGGSEATMEMKRELDILKGLNHDNVVKIKGILRDNNVIIIMEYLKDGSLDIYLQVNKDAINFPRQLYDYALNIIDGMQYLGEKGIIHRDLAARNILVFNEEVVKISDFGLARRAVEDDHYVMSSNTNIPVKWLALECLNHKTFSFASDAWSFGITIWEMFTFGANPNLHGCDNFFKAGANDQQHQADMKIWIQCLEEGQRLPKPEKCSNSLYNLVMLPCWQRDPLKRPNFSELKEVVKKVELEDT